MVDRVTRKTGEKNGAMYSPATGRSRHPSPPKCRRESDTAMGTPRRGDTLAGLGATRWKRDYQKREVRAEAKAASVQKPGCEAQGLRALETLPSGGTPACLLSAFRVSSPTPKPGHRV